jgi:hypothetical protein
MELIRRHRLAFRAATALKLYEIDLCKLAAGKFVVNFRYGKQGGAMREGTKTPSPLPFSMAEELFTKLCRSQRDKGYTDADDLVAAMQPDPVPPPDAFVPASPISAQFGQTFQSPEQMPQIEPTTASNQASQSDGMSDGDLQALDMRSLAILKRLREGDPPADTDADTGAVGSKKAKKTAVKVLKRAKPKKIVRQGQEVKRIWPLDRAIWRAGELRLREAVPLLLRYAWFEQPLRDYSLAWALGRCGQSEAIPALEQLYRMKNKSATSVRYIAAEALWALYDQPQQESFAAELLQSLPQALRDLVAHGEPEPLYAALEAALIEPTSDISAQLETLYLLALRHRHVRAVLVSMLCIIPLVANTFRGLRHIFKAAEFRCDGEVFGILAYRFETEKAMFRYRRYLIQFKINNVVYSEKELEAELKKSNARVAYSNKTRDYLRRRVWRTLRRLAEIGDAENYTRMAVGILLPFTDADSGEVQKKVIHLYENRQYRSRTLYYDHFAKFLAFNQILYANNSRYIKSKSQRSMRKASYQLEQLPPKQREEAFPECWDREPRGLLHLLSESRCLPVHQFAVKAVRANESLLQRLDTAAIVMLLQQPYPVTVELGIELAKRTYDPRKPDISLLKGLLSSNLKTARDLASTWIKANRLFFFGRDLEFTAWAASGPYPDVCQWVRELLLSIAWSHEQSVSLVSALLHRLISLDPNGDFSDLIAKETGKTILEVFAQVVAKIEFELLPELLMHKLPQNQLLAAQIIKAHLCQAERLPPKLLIQLISTKVAGARAIGLELLKRISDEHLRHRREFFSALCILPHNEVRDTIRPIIARLANSSNAFATQLTLELLPHLMRKEQYAGMHSDLIAILCRELSQALETLDKEQMLRLVHSTHHEARVLGLSLLHTHPELPDLSVRELLKLANHEWYGVRSFIWQILRQRIPELKADMLEALRIFDAKWDDTRTFAFELFNQHFTAEDWNPTLLVGICDSVREDVQSFGRSLISRFFDQANGLEYLTKLSQHRSSDLQLFATNYLESVASRQPERLAQLAPYFLSVLSKVNCGRIAKQRLFAFLRTEALQDIKAAQIIAPILNHVSLTMAIGDKAQCLELMRDISLRYPDLDLTITIQPFPRWNNADNQGDHYAL